MIVMYKCKDEKQVVSYSAIKTPSLPIMCFRHKKASAAILLSCDNHNVSLPLTPRPWWEVFIGPSRGGDLTAVCNAILAVGDMSHADARRARFAFVPSLLKNGSFNDPDSYIWSTVKD